MTECSFHFDAGSTSWARVIKVCTSVNGRPDCHRVSRAPGPVVRQVQKYNDGRLKLQTKTCFLRQSVNIRWLRCGFTGVKCQVV